MQIRGQIEGWLHQHYGNEYDIQQDGHENDNRSSFVEYVIQVFSFTEKPLFPRSIFPFDPGVLICGQNQHYVHWSFTHALNASIHRPDLIDRSNYSIALRMAE